MLHVLIQNPSSPITCFVKFNEVLPLLDTIVYPDAWAAYSKSRWCTQIKSLCNADFLYLTAECWWIKLLYQTLAVYLFLFHRSANERVRRTNCDSLQARFDCKLLSPVSSFELMMFKMSFLPVLCTVIYRPPIYSKHFIWLHDFLTEMMPMYDHVLILCIRVLSLQDPG